MPKLTSTQVGRAAEHFVVAESGSSSHHGITTNRVEQWRDRWDLLGIFPPEHSSG